MVVVGRQVLGAQAGDDRPHRVVGEVVVGARPAERRERRGGREEVHLGRVVLGGAEERLPLLPVLLPRRSPQRVAGAVIEGECDRDDAGPGHGDTLLRSPRQTRCPVHTPDRVPDRLGLQERRHPRQAGVGRPVRLLRRCAQDPLHRAGGLPLELHRAAGRCAGQVDGVDVGVLGQPGAELLGVAGEQVDRAAGDVAGGQHLGERDGRQRALLRRDDDGGVAAGQHRGQHADQPEQRRLLRREDGDDAGRLGHREVEVRAGDGVRATQHGGQLVGPARVPDPAVDGGVDGGPRLRLGQPLAGGHLLAELDVPALHDLGDAVEHLAAVVGGHARPLAEGAAGGDDGVPGVLAGGPGGVGEEVPLRVGDLVGAPRLRAGEGPVDVELVGLADGQPVAAHQASFPFRYAARPCRPPSRP